MEEVLEFTKRYTSSTPCEVEIHGFIVQAKEDMVLLDYERGDDIFQDYSFGEKWTNVLSLFIDLPDLEYALQWKLYLMGGGASAYFHEAKITGRAWFDTKTSTHIIIPESLIARNNPSSDWLEIDISPEKIAEGKKRWYVPNKEDYYMPPYE